MERIARLWAVDDNRIVWSEQGFDWWPGHYRVSVRCQKHHKVDENAWRLTIRTEFLKNVPIEDYECRKHISMLSAFAPSYCWVFIPEVLTGKYDVPSDGKLGFQSTVYLREDTQNWLPEFFASMGILQAIDAEKQAESTAAFLKSEINTSLPGVDASPYFLDEMLEIANDIYIPLGREDCRWIGCQEFEQVSSKYGMQDSCFGMGDTQGLTLETPIGSSSALIQLNTDIPHKELGNGLLATILLPFWEEESAIVDKCSYFNFIQSITWNDVPQLGSWHARERNKGEYHPANGTFYPNALYVNGRATNAALWQLGSARWIKSEFYADLEDLTMAEILEKRVPINN